MIWEKIDMSDLPHVLIVDDEPFNIEIIVELLTDEGGYQISSASDGYEAITIMEAEPDAFDVILLDQMMPEMNGMEVLNKMKQHPVLRHCPIIFQTAKRDRSSIIEGLEAGAHYYLTKPFDDEVLRSVVKTAARERLEYKRVLTDLAKSQGLMGLLRNACFEFKTIDEARRLASLISRCFPEPSKVVMGLTELMMNAVEHGNLEITYDEKSTLNSQGKWNDEINKRLAMVEYFDKKVIIQFECSDDEMMVTITDEGNGFDFSKYMNFDPDRVMDNHGRGIAIANTMSFSSIEYNDKGNVVCAQLNLP